MSLPYLKDRKQSPGLIVQTRAADGSHDSSPEDQSDQELTSCGEDIIRAITNKDAKALGAAIQAAFEILESRPHEEAGQPEESEQEGSGE